MRLYERSAGMTAFGGLVGRTTNAVSGYSISCTLNNCGFSGSMTVYAPSESRKNNLSGNTNVFGTVIGCNPATAAGVVTVDGANYTTAASLNAAGTNVSFEVESTS